jgi:hypothetical protein
MKEISPSYDSDAAFISSFYRALSGLLKKELIHWNKAHGGPKSPSGLVSNRKKNVLLIDADSQIPNLALAKISAYHKKQGDSVTLLRGLNTASKLDNWDEVYISCIFTKNGDAARGLARQFPGSEVHIGGTGIDLVTELPPEIESQMPDNSIYHEIYPESKYTSYGFTMRGCIRSCSFCVVREKEGYAHPVCDLYGVWNKEAGHTKVTLFDNNILALPEHFELVASQIKKEGLRVDWNQSLDIRLVTEENAKILAGLRFDPYMRFAFDSIKSESQVRRGLQFLKDAGVRTPAVFDVLIGFDSTFEEDLYRVNTLRSLGQKAFLMRYNSNKEIMKEKRYAYLIIWCNARMHYWTRDFDSYVAGRENGLQKKISTENKKKKKLNNVLEADILKFGARE